MEIYRIQRHDPLLVNSHKQPIRFGSWLKTAWFLNLSFTIWEFFYKCNMNIRSITHSLIRLTYISRVPCCWIAIAWGISTFQFPFVRTRVGEQDVIQMIPLNAIKRLNLWAIHRVKDLEWLYNFKTLLRFSSLRTGHRKGQQLNVELKNYLQFSFTVFIDYEFTNNLPYLL